MMKTIAPTALCSILLWAPLLSANPSDMMAKAPVREPLKEKVISLEPHASFALSFRDGGPGLYGIGLGARFAYQLRDQWSLGAMFTFHFGAKYLTFKSNTDGSKVEDKSADPFSILLGLDLARDYAAGPLWIKPSVALGFIASRINSNYVDDDTRSINSIYLSPAVALSYRLERWYLGLDTRFIAILTEAPRNWGFGFGLFTGFHLN